MVILDRFGAGFTMGAIGGSIWHGCKGFRHSTRGERLTGALSAIKIRAPGVGGRWAAWAGMFATFECAIKDYRRREDPWNTIISGVLTGGFFGLRHGPRSMLNWAASGGIWIGLIEGSGILLNRAIGQHNRPIPPKLEPLQNN